MGAFVRHIHSIGIRVQLENRPSQSVRDITLYIGLTWRQHNIFTARYLELAIGVSWATCSYAATAVVHTITASGVTVIMNGLAVTTDKSLTAAVCVPACASA